MAGRRDTASRGCLGFCGRTALDLKRRKYRVAGTEVGEPGKYLPEQQMGVTLASFSSACKEAESPALPYLRSRIASLLQPVLLRDIGGSSERMEGDSAHRVPGWGEAMRGHR